MVKFQKTEHECEKKVGEKKLRRILKHKDLRRRVRTTPKVVSYIHVADSGKADLELYLKGSRRLQLQVFHEESLPDLDQIDVVNGLDHTGTLGDFCDDNHRCTEACPVGCQGHLRPNEVIIYEGIDDNGRLVNRRKYKGRFILRTESRGQIRKKSKGPLVSDRRVAPLRDATETDVGVDFPEEYLAIINGTPASPQDELEHSWNPQDKSANLSLKSNAPLTIRRHPATQSTDGIRGKVGYSRGVHVYEVGWPVRMRGSHAVVGVANRQAPLRAVGYTALIGSDSNSWGWDIGRKETLTAGTVHRYPAAVTNHYEWTVPSPFYLIIDMDQGTVSFGVEDKWLGVAFSGLQGETVYPAISTVWGHAEVSMRYIGSSLPRVV